MDYNFTITGNTKNYEIRLDMENLYGYFEHHRLGDEQGGGLWFGKPEDELSCIDNEEVSSEDFQYELVDADGTPCVPKEVAEFLTGHGIYVDPAFV